MRVCCHLQSEDYVGVDTLKEIKPDVDPTAFITLTQPTLLPESRIATSHDTKEEVRLDGSSDEEVWAGLERDFTKHSQVEESEAGPIGNRSVIILDDTQSQPSVLSADLWGDSDMVDQFLLGIVDSIDSEWPAKINAIPSGDADDGELSVPQRLEDPLDVLWDNAGNFAFQAFDSVGHNNHRVSPISPRNDNSQAVVETNDFRQWLEENVVVVYTENGADDV
ncbi:hypothetical protein DFQ30_005795 [Apophysomyces sp. BC1015]|nr:hypothetical protein DFQ30_005795 [Apophysomyces sp. BC1015]